jgi:transposase
MFSLNDSQRFYLYTPATDMRKGFDSLAGLVLEGMGRNPLSGEVFIFLNRERTTIKLLHWERGGLVLYHKRLERGRFTLPQVDNHTQSCSMEWRDLVLMVEGIEPSRIVRKTRLEKVG